jgi:tetratricopeptide (TPR) repeat protein
VAESGAGNATRAGARFELLAVAAVALAASLAGLGNEFVQDDLPLIAQNQRLHDLGNWRALLSSPFWPPPYSPDLYRPLTSLLLAVEWAVGGGAPFLFRLVSYALYAASAIALLLAARRLLPGPIALLVALLFAAHPVHVEATALGVAQNELLIGLLACLMLIRYLDARGYGSAAHRTVPAGSWLLLAGWYLAACLFKETGFVLAGLLLAAELLLFRGRRPWGRLLPGYAVLLAAPVAALLLRAAVFPGRLAGSFVAEALEGQGIGGRALTMLTVVPEWVRLLLVPVRLQSDYSPAEIQAASGLGAAGLAGLLVLLAGTAALVATWRKAPIAAFGLAWAGIALLPVSNLLVPTGIVLAERTLFLPGVGVAIALGGALAALGRTTRLGTRTAGLVAAAGILVIGAGVVRSTLRQADWRSEAVFIERAARDAPRSWRTQKAYGALLFERGQEASGLAAYDRSLRLAPPGLAWRVRNDLALRYWEKGENREAARQLRLSLADAPEAMDTRHYLVVAHLVLGEYPEAMAAADSALRRGGDPALFAGLRALADTAQRASAPPGSIRVRLRPAPLR